MDAKREWNLIEQMVVGDFNPNHDPQNGQFAAAPGTYQYHATTASAIWSIYEQGLKPSKRGQLGPGVYFAPTEHGAKDWTELSTGGKRVLRVKTQTLKDKYGWEDVDDTQSVAKRKISPKDIEIRVTGTGEWLSLPEYKELYWRSYRMWKTTQ